jgi:hypothetical protein
MGYATACGGIVVATVALIKALRALAHISPKDIKEG